MLTQVIQRERLQFVHTKTTQDHSMSPKLSRALLCGALDFLLYSAARADGTIATRDLARVLHCFTATKIQRHARAELEAKATMLPKMGIQAQGYRD